MSPSQPDPPKDANRTAGDPPPEQVTAEYHHATTPARNETPACPPTTSCPTPEDLRRLVAATASAAETAAFTAHIQTCPACQRSLAQFTRSGSMHRTTVGETTSEQADCIRLINHMLEELREEGETASEVADGSTRPPSSHTSAPPTPPGYELAEELGRGGMGVVYKARQTALNRDVALKVVLAGGHASTIQRIRFLQEAEAAAAVNHPHVVQVYDFGTWDGQPFLALEYCPGGTLAEKLKGNPVTATEAASLAEILARAVAAAHRKGIVHRDLKPANVLLTADGTPKVSDFGLAKMAESGDGLTLSGAVMGTPSYMSPEQAAGSGKSVGPPSDVWALGAILYECLTGRPPFKATTAAETLLLVLNQEPVGVRQLNPQVPVDLETVCLKCLRKESGRRYESADALADDLRRFLDGRPVVARPVGPIERGVRWARRNRSLAAALGLAAIALVAVTVVSLIAADRDSRNAHDLEDKNNQLGEALNERGKALGELKDALDKIKDNNIQLGKALGDAKTQKDKADDKTRLAEGRLRDFLRAQAMADLRQGQTLCEQGDVARGLLWIAQGYGTAHQAEVADVERAATRMLAGWGGALHPLRRVADVYAVRPDGRTALMPGEMAGGVQLRDLLTGVPRGPVISSGRAPKAVLSPDGGTVTLSLLENHLVHMNAQAARVVANTRLQSSVGVVAYAPGGQTLVTIGREGLSRTIVTLIRPATGEILTTRKFPTLVEKWAFTPGGLGLIYSTGNRTFVLDTATGKDLIPSQLFANHLASPDGVTLLIRTRERTRAGETGQLWELRTGKEVGPAFQTDAPRVCFSADGRTLLLAEGTVVKRRDAATGEELVPPAQPGGKEPKPERPAPFAHPFPITLMVPSPDGKVVATSCTDNTVRCWVIESGELAGPPLAVLEPVEQIVFAADGKTVVTRTGRAVHVWSVATGKRLCPPLAHEGIAQAEISPDGKRLLTKGNYRIQVWNPDTGQPVGPPIPYPSRVEDVTFGPDSRTILTRTYEEGSAHSLRLWEVAPDLEVGVPLPHDGPVSKVVWTASGKEAVSASGKEVRAWSAETGKPLGPPLVHPDTITELFPSPDGTAVFTICQGQARLWDTRTGNIRTDKIPPIGGAVGVWFSPDSRFLAVSGFEIRTGRKMYLYDAATGAPSLGSNLKQDDVLEIQCAGFTPDSRAMLTGGAGGGSAHLIAFWDLTTLTQTPRVVRLPLLDSYQYQFSPDGRTLLAVGYDSVERRDVATLAKIDTPLRHPARLRVAKWSPDGKFVVTVCEDRGVRLWDAAGKPVGNPFPHPTVVETAELSPDGMTLLTACEDGSVRLWDVATGRLIAPPRLGALGTRFSPDGGSVWAVVGQRRVAWPLPQAGTGSPEQYAAWVRVRTGLDLDGSGSVGELDRGGWSEQLKRLTDLGGPPVK